MLQIENLESRKDETTASNSNNRVIQIINDNQGPITCVTFAKRDSDMIAAGYHSGQIRIFSTRSGKLLSTAQIHQAPVTRLKLTDCRNYLVSLASDGSVFNLTNDGECEQVAELVSQHKSAIHALGVSKFNFVVTGSKNFDLCVYAGLDSIEGMHDQEYESPFGRCTFLAGSFI